MANVTGPGGDLCANVEHIFTATDSANCLTIEWVIVQTPNGVSHDDVIFTSKYALQTGITVPVEGLYIFGLKCCEAA